MGGRLGMTDVVDAVVGNAATVGAKCRGGRDRRFRGGNCRQRCGGWARERHSRRFGQQPAHRSAPDRRRDPRPRSWTEIHQERWRRSTERRSRFWMNPTSAFTSPTTGVPCRGMTAATWKVLPLRMATPLIDREAEEVRAPRGGIDRCRQSAPRSKALIRSLHQRVVAVAPLGVAGAIVPHDRCRSSSRPGRPRSRIRPGSYVPGRNLRRDEVQLGVEVGHLNAGRQGAHVVDADLGFPLEIGNKRFPLQTRS